MADNPSSGSRLDNPSGGSRAQRRNRARARVKAQQEDATKKDAAADPEEAEPEEEEEPTLERAEQAEAEQAEAEPLRKKTKKEKRREKKALEQALSPPPAVQPESETRKRARDAVEGGLRLFVGRLPQSTTEPDLRSCFDGVTEVDMLYRHDTGRFKGSAFLSFVDAAAASVALAKDATAFSGKSITVQRAANAPNGPSDGDAGTARDGKRTKRHEEQTQTNGAGQGSAPSLSVFLGNLPAVCTEKAVREAFRTCGKIQKVKLLPPHQAEPDRRPGFIDFQSLESSAAAIHLGAQGKPILGRLLTITYSGKAKPPSGGGRRSKEAKQRRRALRDEQRAHHHTPDSYAEPAAATS